MFIGKRGSDHVGFFPGRRGLKSPFLIDRASVFPSKIEVPSSEGLYLVLFP